MSALVHPLQPKQDIIGNSTTPATLTGTYTDNSNTFTVEHRISITLYIDYTPAENNGVLNVKVLLGPTGASDYQLIQTVRSGSTETIYLRNKQFTGASNGTTYKFRDIESIADPECTIQVSETATSHGTVRIQAVLSGI